MYNPSHINKEHPMNSNFCFNMAMRISSRLITQFYDERLSVFGWFGIMVIIVGVSLIGIGSRKIKKQEVESGN